MFDFYALQYNSKNIITSVTRVNYKQLSKNLHKF